MRVDLGGDRLPVDLEDDASRLGGVVEVGGDVGQERAEIGFPLLEDEISRLDPIQLGKVLDEALEAVELARDDPAEVRLVLRREPPRSSVSAAERSPASGVRTSCEKSARNCRRTPSSFIEPRDVDEAARRRRCRSSPAKGRIWRSIVSLRASAAERDQLGRGLARQGALERLADRRVADDRVERRS